MLAAGTGNRFKEKLPKQFFLINNIPVFIRTIKTVIDEKWLGKIILVINNDYKEKYLEYLKEHNINMKMIEIVNGGNHRFDSIKNGLSLVKTKIVIVMEGARPFASKELYRKLIKHENDNVISVFKPVNTSYIIQNGKPIKAIPTNTYVHSVSPKKYNFKMLKETFEDIDYSKNDEYELFKDNMSKFDIVYSESTNIKITNPIDKYIANIFVKSMD